jgi:hypothetical protein
MIAPVRSLVARRALLEKGFQVASGNRDHEMFFYFHEGRQTAFHVKISHSARDIRRDEIRNNARPFHITGDSLYRILCCEADAAETAQIWTSRGQ